MYIELRPRVTSATAGGVFYSVGWSAPDYLWEANVDGFASLPGGDHREARRIAVDVDILKIEHLSIFSKGGSSPLRLVSVLGLRRRRLPLRSREESRRSDDNASSGALNPRQCCSAILPFYTLRRARTLNPSVYFRVISLFYGRSRIKTLTILEMKRIGFWNIFKEILIELLCHSCVKML